MASARLELPAIRFAATLILVREQPRQCGFEVFMVERPGTAAFGGLHVFPGGKVDPSDSIDALHCDGLTDAVSSAMLGLREGGLAYWVAAIRESFEEAGVLFGRVGDRPVDFTDPDIAERFAAYRDELQRGAMRMVDLCHREGVVLSAGDVQYFSHWITPEGAPARFDTRFFLAVMPADQEVAHHEAELESGDWVVPSRALEHHRDGRWRMIYPTLTTLEILSRYDSIASLQAAVRARSHLPEVTAERLRQGMQPS